MKPAAKEYIQKYRISKNEGISILINSGYKKRRGIE
jgi:hypothetical protein